MPLHASSGFGLCRSFELWALAFDILSIHDNKEHYRLVPLMQYVVSLSLCFFFLKGLDLVDGDLKFFRLPAIGRQSSLQTEMCQKLLLTW